MRVIGTAGHVDHGKSTLVRRLTGIDPDRLKEEKARAMTIDLGFAWFDLPSGETIGIVDVPGHRDFIENMLAGVGGIDAVILVIAADEGIMPQTREHLAILDLLDIQQGVIALTKTDLIDDDDWLALVEQDIRDALADTTLIHAPIIRVSAHTGYGIQQLIDQLSSLLVTLPPHMDSGQPRMSIDRIFTISGFGTVVTGTLLGGSLRTGAEVELQPNGLRGRIRSLQSYRQSVDVAQPGSRVAVNLTGVDKQLIARGHVLTYPAMLHATQRVDAWFRHLPDASRPLKHHAQVKLFVGAAETTARVRLLADEILPPGSESWIQLQLDHPLALARIDRFILRCPSPSETIGGGIIVNPHPERRWKRFQPEIINRLDMQLHGSSTDRIIQIVSHEPLKRPGIQQKSGLSASEVDAALQQAVQANQIIELPDQQFLAAVTFQRLLQTLQQMIADYHARAPLHSGMPREQLRSQLGIKQNLFTALLQAASQVVIEGNTVRLDDHSIRFTAQQEKQIADLMNLINQQPFSPPSYQQAAQQVGEEILIALIQRGDLIQVQADVIFSAAAYQTLTEAVHRIIEQTGEVTTAALRDEFTTSRKYAIALLEHLDQIGVTRRVGDVRVHGPRA